MTLAPEQKIFAGKYLIGLSATRAYKVAYPSCRKDRAATVSGSKLLRNTKVAEYVQKCMKDRGKRIEITQDWVLEELWKTTSASDTDFTRVMREPAVWNNSYVADPDTDQIQTRDVIRITLAEELLEEKRAVISAVKETKFGINVKAYDRVGALEFLGRHLEVFKDKVELSGGLGIGKTKLDDLLQQMRGGD